MALIEPMHHNKPNTIKEANFEEQGNFEHFRKVLLLIYLNILIGDDKF